MTTTMQITQDKMDYARLTQADVDANDSVRIANKVDVILSAAARMSLSQLIDQAERAESELEAQFALGNMAAAMDARTVMDDLILRAASAPVPDLMVAEARVRCLAKHWKTYRDASRSSVALAIIGAALVADCTAHGLSISWADPPATKLH